VALLAGVLAFTASNARSQQPANPDTALPTITSAHAAHSLPVEEATRKYPVHLRAVVTYYDPYIDPRHGALFVCDSSGCIFIEIPSRPLLPIHAGTLIDIEGVSGTGDYAPVIVQAQIRVIGESHVPATAPRVNLAEMMTGAEDGQWIEITGIVRSVVDSAEDVTLNVAASDGIISATTLKDPNVDYSGLVDATVQIHANIAPLFSKNRQIAGVRLFFPGSSALKIEEPAPPDAFALPLHPISHLLRFEPDAVFLHLVHVRGRVTLEWPGRLLCIQDDTGGLCASITQSNSVAQGNWADVVGFPIASGFAPALEDAAFRPGDAGQPVASEPITATQGMTGDYDAKLVQIDARLVDLDLSEKTPTLMLSSDGILFSAALVGSPRGTLAWKPGSDLRLTGVFSVQVDTTRITPGDWRPQVVGFRILLRSPQDVVLIKSPSWWTPLHAISLVGAVTLAVFVVLAWVIVLRKRVRQQTRTIRHQLRQRLASQEELSETNQVLKALVDASPAAIVCVDRDGNTTVWNPAAERMSGWTEKEVLGRPFPMISAERREIYNDLLSAALRGENQWNHEGVALKKDGSTPRDVIVSTAPLRDAAGEVRGAMHILLDITDRKAVEAQLHLQAAALESTANSVVISDKSGRILWANPAFTTLTGYSVEEVTGQTLEILASGKQPAAFFETLRKTISDGQVWHGEIINRRKDGTLYSEEQSVTPVRNEKGEIIHFVTIQQDVTDRKSLEEQLQKASKMESVGRLAGGVAHDFNNLLSVIIGYSEVLLGNPALDALSQKQIEEIKKAGDRATGLTRQLLAFSRQQVLEPKILDLNSIVVETEKMLRRLIGEDIEFQTKLAPAMGSVKVDPGQIEQILMNLAVNARDAMPHGGKLILETSEAELDEQYARHNAACVPGRYVVLTVRDTGSGMDEETKAHIFEPFFTTKERGKGTGLGLATVYGIVKQSGGYVWVDSEPERGTAFKIYLPRVEQRVLKAHAGDLPAEVSIGSESVLVVEDEESVRTLICSILEQNGYTVLEADSPARAFEIARQHQVIHLVLTDVVMPGMSGPKMVKKIEEMRPGLKVLFMSGYAGGFGAAQGMLEGGASLLQKPFSKHALLQRVRETLEAHSEIKPA
jgi:two-component system, cell cycle sensor histidine kinase and response regulator CckA